MPFNLPRLNPSILQLIPNSSINLNSKNIPRLSKNLFLMFFIILIINCYFCLILQVSSTPIETNDQNLKEEKYSFNLNSPKLIENKRENEEQINYFKKQKTKLPNFLFLNEEITNNNEDLNNKINKRGINGQTFIERIIKGNERRRELLKWKRGAGDFCGCNMGCFYHSMGLCASCCSLGL